MTNAFPFVAVVTHGSGIHPSTSRLVSLDAITFDAEGEIGEEYRVVLRSGTDPGPTHQHGLTHEDVSHGVGFKQVLKPLDRLIDGRSLIVHNGPRTWGFIVSEAKTVMQAAARANRSRSRNAKGRRHRQKVGHVPQPVEIIDTLATGRRHRLDISDTRIAAVAKLYDIPALSPVASVERTKVPAAEVARTQTLLVRDIYLHQRAQVPEAIVTRDPASLKADRFGLQRSIIRVDAARAPRLLPNPGKYVPGEAPVPGMEFVIAPETHIDPNILIEAGTAAGLVYNEKLTRESSLVVTNRAADDPHLDGKAMHAQRKGIPLVTDTDFLEAMNTMPPSQ